MARQPDPAKHPMKEPDGRDAPTSAERPGKAKAAQHLPPEQLPPDPELPVAAVRLSPNEASDISHTLDLLASALAGEEHHFSTEERQCFERSVALLGNQPSRLYDGPVRIKI